jgi:hypothetical protein
MFLSIQLGSIVTNNLPSLAPIPGYSTVVIDELTALTLKIFKMQSNGGMKNEKPICSFIT